MKLYQWDSMAEFDDWHNALCNQLGYPKYPLNQETGEVDRNAESTKSYTTAWIVEGKAIAYVGDEYNEGLILTDLQPPNPPRF